MGSRQGRQAEDTAMQQMLRALHRGPSLWRRGHRPALAGALVLAGFLAGLLGSGRLAVASHGPGTGRLVGTSGTVRQPLHYDPAVLRRFEELGAGVAQQSAVTTPLGMFEATGLPAGAATGVASHSIAPPGFQLKHVHGGPGYAFVVAGYLVL